MRIEKLFYHNHVTSWQLAPMEFGDINLLVDISGVGKTEIINAIRFIVERYKEKGNKSVATTSGNGKTQNSKQDVSDTRNFICIRQLKGRKCFTLVYLSILHLIPPTYLYDFLEDVWQYGQERSNSKIVLHATDSIG